MKTFLKVLLLVIAALVAIKLLPLTFALGCLLAGALLGLIALGVSAVVALMGAAIVFAAVTSPIWVPVLVIVGLVSLFKRDTRRSGAVVA